MIRINAVAFPSPIHGALANPVPPSPTLPIHSSGSGPGLAGRWAEYQCLDPLTYGVHHRRHFFGLNEVKILRESPTPAQTGCRCQAQGQAQSLSWNLVQNHLVRMKEKESRPMMKGKKSGSMMKVKKSRSMMMKVWR